MAAQDHLGVQFVFHKANPNEMGGISTHTLEAWDPEHASSPWAQAHPAERNRYTGSDVDPGIRPIGSISWHHKTGEIRGVYVVPEHQRKGIATAMLHEAQTTPTRSPRHSTDRTTAGDAWARSAGGPLPRRSSAADAIQRARTEIEAHGPYQRTGPRS